MLYREFGKTGCRVSLLGFGGMRFEDINDENRCVNLILNAYQAGINYFDTAPIYCESKSEEVFGKAFAQMSAQKKETPFYISTKSSAATADGVYKDFDRSLKRMNVDYVDFFHVWWVVRPEAYFDRKAQGALDAFSRLKEEGRIGSIVLSSHMSGQESEAVLNDYPFDGILLGYSALNAAYREKAIGLAADAGRGVVIMNPLAGGMIPQFAEKFNFLTQDDETVVEGALRFLFDDTRVSVVLVGYGNQKELDEALSAVNGYNARNSALREKILAGELKAFDQLCTGCGYCDSCPEGIPLPRMMQSLDARLFSDDPMKVSNTLQFGHGLSPQRVKEFVSKCVDCGHCEPLCTQKLPIVSRLTEIERELQRAKK